MDSPLEPPRWLDREPEVLWGCTQPELGVLLTLAVGIVTPVSVLFAVFGRVGEVSLALLAVPLSGALVYLLVRLGAWWIRLAKRGRPPGYYRLRWHLWLARQRLLRTPYILYHGPWRLGR